MNFLKYVTENYHYIFNLTFEHIRLTFIAVFFAIIIGIPLGILINNYKILASNYTNNQNEYKSIGTLNIILTPFDNVIKFQIAKQDSANLPIVPYNLSEMLLNSKDITGEKNEKDHRKNKFI